MKPLDTADRYDLCETIAQKWTDNMELKELENFYFAAQFDYLDGMTDAELLEMAKDANVEVAAYVD